ncbi:hypothetical protein EZV62_027645 [Acer yangbiense]|uniref:Uncharacterized protein n=1 Tax=Acer yangbiense TaxID=1000413 RepID=A0A5C7GUA3_9ROSI|nr:hypothetical protein EZV62_027645 [Acer yangbiense]
MATSSSRNPCWFLDSPTTATHGPINTQPKIRACNCCVSESSRDQLLKLMLDNIERISELFLNRHLYMTDESIARQQEAERRRKSENPGFGNKETSGLLKWIVMWIKNRLFLLLSMLVIKRQEKFTATLQEDIINVREAISCNGDRDMQTADQQTHMLRMLEKSFAREMDLENKLTESRLIEEELKLRLLSSEQMFDKADRETELILKLDGPTEQLDIKENALQ